MDHKENAYIGIGSNIGDKFRHCTRAVELIGELEESRIEKRSEWFITKPVGVTGQDWYVNGVICLGTDMQAGRLLNRLLGIEQQMGRVRRERWGPRNIDLDLLLFGRETIDAGDLTLPHPRMHLRRFVLVPLAQIAPHLVHPTLKKTVNQLLAELPEEDQIVQVYRER